jgi:hypothetical protein
VAGTTRRYVRDAGLFLTEYLARDDSDFGALMSLEWTSCRDHWTVAAI